MIACAVINANRSKGRPVLPHDVFPHLQRRRHKASPEKIRRRIEELHLLFGGEPRKG